MTRDIITNPQTERDLCLMTEIAKITAALYPQFTQGIPADKASGETPVSLLQNTQKE